MPKINIKKQSSLSAEDAFEKVTNLLQDNDKLKKFDSSYECNFDKSRLKGKISGQLFEADLAIYEESPGSQIEITIQLPLRLALAKSMVASTLQKMIDKVIPS